ncbi:putative longevity-assurance protein [Bisporella sp. PMI_857]|nr:putative longevity-assurance protein [Bisporella sp. PMI_857]
MPEPYASTHSHQKLPVQAQSSTKYITVKPLIQHRDSTPYLYLDWFSRNQIACTLSFLGSVILLQTLAKPFRAYTGRFLYLSYARPATSSYQQGIDDIYYVFAWVVNFTALRAITIEWILRPISGYLGVSERNRLRFAEQGWLVAYYGIFWTIGMFLWINSDYWLDNKAIWAIWPSRDMSGLFKWYNLAQLAFWVQQILVIHMEKRRKDHTQMLTHHIITCTLISVTYVYRYTRAANVVLCLMDVVDLILPIAKILRYLCYETACNIAFGLFVVLWFLARHVMYLQLCYGIYSSVPGNDTMLFGCYQGGSRQRLDMPPQPDYFSHLLWPFESADGVICLNGEVKWIFLGMLGFVQALSMIWFTMILKVIAGILIGKSVEDTRSEDEAEDDNTEIDSATDVKKQMNVMDLNICVSSGEMGGTTGALVNPGLKPRFTNTRRRSGALEKEILARIGCEKPQ